MALSPNLTLPRSATTWSLLRVAAGRKRRDFNDWIRKLPHRLHENLDDFCVELGIRAAFQFGQSIGCRAALFVSSIACDGVVRIGNGHDTRTERNVFASQGVRVARSIEEFMVVQDHLPNPR